MKHSVRSDNYKVYTDNQIGSMDMEPFLRKYSQKEISNTTGNNNATFERLYNHKHKKKLLE